MSNATLVFFDGTVYLGQTYVGVSGTKDTATGNYTLNGVPTSISFLVAAEKANAVVAQANKCTATSTPAQQAQIGAAVGKFTDGAFEADLRVAVAAYITQVTKQEIPGNASQVSVTFELNTQSVAVLNAKNVNPIDESASFFTLNASAWGGSSVGTPSKDAVKVSGALSGLASANQKAVDTASGVQTNEVAVV